MQEIREYKRPDTRKSTYELIKVTFGHLNDFKRWRAKAEHATDERDISNANLYTLNAYKSIDALELALRGLQSLERNK